MLLSLTWGTMMDLSVVQKRNRGYTLKTGERSYESNVASSTRWTLPVVPYHPENGAR
jgi:hypothetical protein